MKKNVILKSVLTLVVLVVLAAACKDKEAEKRIAALESELSEMKSANKGVETSTPLPAEHPPITTPAEEKPDGPVAEIAFRGLEYDFGTIKEGVIAEHTFEFTNTGTVPLVISEARPSCGCTVPDWTKEPIPAGGKGYVKAKFDTNGKKDLQQKTITVTANTFPKQTVLKFKAMVTPKTPEPPAGGPLKQ